MKANSTVPFFKSKTSYLIWKSARPEQWIKNIFLFAGILFSQNILNIYFLFKVTCGFFIFCLLSGSVYIINDLIDLNHDRFHPLKSTRPLASGRLDPYHARISVLIFVPVTLIVSYILNSLFFIVALGYIILQISYSLFLKNVIILDVFVIASGFLLRVIAGALIIRVEISSWFLICSTLLALFLGFCKRRHELVTLEKNAQNHRKILGDYSTYLLDQMISVVAASTVIAYSLYTISKETITKFGTKNLIFTIPFVLYGIFRYLFLLHQKDKGGNPESIMFTDRPLLITILLWAITVVIILYG